MLSEPRSSHTDLLALSRVIRQLAAHRLALTSCRQSYYQCTIGKISITTDSDKEYFFNDIGREFLIGEFFD